MVAPAPLPLSLNAKEAAGRALWAPDSASSFAQADGAPSQFEGRAAGLRRRSDDSRPERQFQGGGGGASPLLHDPPRLLNPYEIIKLRSGTVSMIAQEDQI